MSAVLFSIGSTDIMFVYPNQTEIKIRKLNPNSAISINILNGVAGTREIREMAPIDRARPKIRSESDSIRGFGLLVISPKCNRSHWL